MDEATATHRNAASDLDVHLVLRCSCSVEHVERQATVTLQLRDCGVSGWAFEIEASTRQKASVARSCNQVALLQ